MKNKTLALIVFAMIIIAFAMVTLSGWIDQRLGMAIVLGLIVLFDVVVAILAYRAGVFAIFILMVVFAIVGLAVCGFDLYMLSLPPVVKTNYYLEVKPSEYSREDLYIQSGYHFYTYGVEEPTVVNEDNGNRETLKDALESGHLKLDDILAGAIKDEEENGNAIYYDGGEAQRDYDEYSIIVCSNSDVIFSQYDCTYKAGICSNVLD